MQQATANILFYLHGTEFMFADALGANAKGFSGQEIVPMTQGILENGFKIAERIIVDQRKIGDAGRACEYIGNFCGYLCIRVGAANFNFSPIALHINRHTQVSKQYTQVIAQLLDKSFAHRRAFNNDFGENFNDEMHSNTTGRGVSQREETVSPKKSRKLYERAGSLA